ncbi:hypothetical protein V8E54_006246 [Elaphomyces granulatus]
MKDTLQSPAFPGDHCFRYRLFTLNTFAYPLMAQAVRDFLPVPSAEVAIERVFSGKSCTLVY